jgi:hypothetical protein
MWRCFLSATVFAVDISKAITRTFEDAVESWMEKYKYKAGILNESCFTI